MASDVFISYYSKDRDVANPVCLSLESNDIKYWVAPRDCGDDAGKYARLLFKEIYSLSVFLDERDVEPTNNRTERTLRFEVPWRNRSKGTQSEKGNRWVVRILSFKQNCRMRSWSTFPSLVEAVDFYFKNKKTDLKWVAQG